MKLTSFFFPSFILFNILSFVEQIKDCDPVIGVGLVISFPAKKKSFRRLFIVVKR